MPRFVTGDMDQNPGTSKENAQPAKKRKKYNQYKEKKLTDAEIRQIWENPSGGDEVPKSDSELDGDEEYEDDPFLNDSEDDPEYIPSSADESDDEEEELPSRSGSPAMPAVGIPDNPTLQLIDTPCSSKEDVNPASPGSPAIPDTPVTTDATNEQWSNQEVRKQGIPFTAESGILVDVEGTEPIHYFELLATKEFYESLCNKANAHAVELLARSEGEQSRISRWKDITLDEIKVFLGILFHMGTIRMNRINDYWKKDYLFNLPTFSAFMSRNRFLLILRALHFEEIDTQTPRTQMGKILPLVNFFNNRMQVIYYPDRELSIDESMVLWRGRLKFRQYIKGKRHKFGIKLYVLCEPKGMSLKIIVYSGAADRQLSGSLHTEKVVLCLLEKYLGVGHSVFMDNFYNSVKLTKDLLEKKTYVTGTLRANRKGNPPEVLTKKLKKGELVMQFDTNGICVIKWKDRREILAISSEFSGQLEEVRTQRGQVVMKPQIINEYNKFMAGVDHFDQMLSYYSCEHKTLIWYKKLAIHVFQIMLLNSHQLYKKHTGSRKSFYDFRLEVIRKLLGPQPPDPVAKIILQHLPEYCPKGENGKAKRRRCCVCWGNGQRKDSVYYCPQCPGGPGVCLTPCFRLFHSTK